MLQLVLLLNTCFSPECDARELRQHVTCGIVDVIATFFQAANEGIYIHATPRTPTVRFKSFLNGGSKVAHWTGHPWVGGTIGITSNGLQMVGRGTTLIFGFNVKAHHNHD